MGRRPGLPSASFNDAAFTGLPLTSYLLAMRREAQVSDLTSELVLVVGFLVWVRGGS